ncbi:hypothetical protein [Dyadobacter sp. CY356]|uniref:hypothetical protein n=1 Tax=Dyadobacter sp. CY356 TaxID=2906442 RepID=UPI001F477988|nr:hypothetical protein [Dyadobacter sp. CY356]MCF0055535.1 hypothetical protein [Dyadobacter sp. CY356]
MKVIKVEQHETCEILHFQAVSRNSYPADGSDEDNTYANFTPSGSVTLTVANKDLHGNFKAGDKYFIDFTKAE